MDIQEILQLQLSFFKEEDLKKEIARKCKVLKVDPGTAILKEGRYVKIVPILLNGLIRVVQKEKGKEVLLYYIYPLESCIVSIHCGMNLLKSRVKAIAEDHSMVLLIPSDLISEWQRKYPSFLESICGKKLPLENEKNHLF